MSFLGGWFAYGLGKATGRALLGPDEPRLRRPDAGVRSMTEAEIQADEERFAREAKRLEEEDAKRR